MDDTLLKDIFGEGAPSLRVDRDLIEQVDKWWNVNVNAESSTSGEKPALIAAEVKAYLMAFKQNFRMYLDKKTRDMSPTSLALLTFQDLAEIFNVLYTNRKKSLQALLNKQDLRSLLRKADSPELMKEDVIVCVHLWLRVDFAHYELKSRPDPAWPMDTSLCDALSKLFPARRSPASLGQAVPLSDLSASAFHALEYTERAVRSNENQTTKELVPTKYFRIFEEPAQYWPEEYTAAFFNIPRYIRITWTEDLRVHLRLDKKVRCLHLFHLASFLSCSQVAKEMFPASLFRETLETIALLVPAERLPGKVNKWFGQIVKTRDETEVPLDSAVKQQRASDSSRAIAHYHYWSQHLIELLAVMDNCKPQTPRQWLHDDRDNQQRTTVLIGVAALLSTAIFSLVQTILTGVQLSQGKQTPEVLAPTQP